MASLNEQLNLNRTCKPVIVNKTLFQLDGYSETPLVPYEIYSRIGEMSVAQNNKISKDILKMLLIEKISEVDEMPDQACLPAGRSGMTTEESSEK